jgi:hypothetical protein
MTAVREAVAFSNKPRKATMEYFNIKFNRQGKATATLGRSGLSLTELENMLTAVVAEVSPMSSPTYSAMQWVQLSSISYSNRNVFKKRRSGQTPGGTLRTSWGSEVGHGKA